jgi:hypothetical protein
MAHPVSDFRRVTCCCDNFKDVKHSQAAGIHILIFTRLVCNSAGPSGRAVYCRLPAAIVGSNHTGAWMFVCCVFYVLSGRGLCDELITRP